MELEDSEGEGVVRRMSGMSTARSGFAGPTWPQVCRACGSTIHFWKVNKEM